MNDYYFHVISCPTIERACERGENPEFFKSLKKEQMEIVLRYSSLYAQLDIVKFALENGATDVNGAVKYASSIEIVKILVSHGATELDSCLSRAMMFDNLKLVRFLTKNINSKVANVRDYISMKIIHTLLSNGFEIDYRWHEEGKIRTCTVMTLMDVFCYDLVDNILGYLFDNYFA